MHSINCAHHNRQTVFILFGCSSSRSTTDDSGELVMRVSVTQSTTNVLLSVAANTKLGTIDATVAVIFTASAATTAAADSMLIKICQIYELLK